MIHEAKWEKDPVTQWWETPVILTQISFQEVHLLEALAWTTMLIMVKGGGYFRGIGLV